MDTDKIMTLACSVWTPSDPILYGLRRMYLKRTKFHKFKVHHKDRNLLTSLVKGELLDLVEDLIQSLPHDDYLPSYYAVLLKERLSGASVEQEH